MNIHFIKQRSFIHVVSPHTYRFMRYTVVRERDSCGHVRFCTEMPAIAQGWETENKGWKDFKYRRKSYVGSMYYLSASQTF
jgi:hypothetical protein